MWSTRRACAVALRGVGRATTSCAPSATNSFAAAVHVQWCSSSSSSSSSKRGFSSKVLRPEVIRALRSVGITSPTPIQAASATVLAAGKDALLAAETGSGKTMAYLAPIISGLRAEEHEANLAAAATDGASSAATLDIDDGASGGAGGGDGSDGGDFGDGGSGGSATEEDDSDEVQLFQKPNRPRALILVPTRELVQQVLNSSKALCHDAKFRPIGLHNSLKRCGTDLQRGSDIAVCVPSRAQLLRDRGSLFLSEVRYIVIDEADTLMDETFMPSVQPLLAACKPEFRSGNQKKQQERSQKTQRWQQPNKQKSKKNKDRRPPVQLVVVGATLKSAGYNLLRKTLPEMEMVSTKTLHKLPAAVTQRYERVFGADGRMTSLLRLIQKEKMRRIVFCNSVASCQWAAKVMSEEGIPAAQLHGQLSVKERGKHFASFANGDCNTLVATDIASRGIDAEVDQVIMFEFPSNTTDYLHRAGRTGRNGKPGEVVVLVGKNDAKMAHDVKAAIMKGGELPGLADEKFRENNPFLRGRTAKYKARPSQKANARGSGLSGIKGRKSNIPREPKPEPGGKHGKSKRSPANNRTGGRRASTSTSSVSYGSGRP